MIYHGFYVFKVVIFPGMSVIPTGSMKNDAAVVSLPGAVPDILLVDLFQSQLQVLPH